MGFVAKLTPARVLAPLAAAMVAQRHSPGEAELPAATFVRLLAHRSLQEAGTPSVAALRSTPSLRETACAACDTGDRIWSPSVAEAEATGSGRGRCMTRALVFFLTFVFSRTHKVRNGLKYKCVAHWIRADCIEYIHTSKLQRYRRFRPWAEYGRPVVIITSQVAATTQTPCADCFASFSGAQWSTFFFEMIRPPKQQS